MKTILLLLLLLISCSPPKSMPDNVNIGGAVQDNIDTIYLYPDGSDWYHGQDTSKIIKP